MAELSKSKRVFFASGKQKDFLEKVIKKIGFTQKELARFLSLSQRTITDWKREKYSMTYKAVKKLSKRAGLPIPDDIKTKDQYWYVTKASSAGGTAMYKKYGYVGGNPKERKEKWYKWWNEEGRFRKHQLTNRALPVTKPKKSELLAEFCGIIMGDGGISQRQITITLDSETDKNYTQYVIKSIQRLFRITPGLNKKKDSRAHNIVISRSELVNYFVNHLELRRGNKIKHQIDIPLWIKRNKSYCTACVRGLVDTDGCVFTHSYRVKGKMYRYKKMSFTSLSKPLLHSVYEILQDIGLHPRLDSTGRDVRLDSKEDVLKYFEKIGSHNKKHLFRYHN